MMAVYWELFFSSNPVSQSGFQQKSRLTVKVENQSRKQQQVFFAREKQWTIIRRGFHRDSSNFFFAKVSTG